jgi:glycosyltransferase involved in cell wall biosynthesis
MQSRHVLMVAYHYPPIRGSSGFQRTLAFSKYLRDHNWNATVLTVDRCAYEEVSDANEHLVPQHVRIVRAPALDTARHLSFRGRYFDFMALPDRWQSWIPGAILHGLATMRTSPADVLFSTFPIASAHVIALALHRLSGTPWVADLRDPMDQITYPANPKVRRAYRWIEERVFREADRVLVTTPGTASLYRERYGQLADEKLVVIANGFDPEAFPSNFRGTSQSRRPQNPVTEADPIVLLHSGLLYPRERDPQPFFRALARLIAEDAATLRNVRVVLRATGYDRMYSDMIREFRLSDVVYLEPALPYDQAIRETLVADALLIFQAQNCDRQIPAKAYECLYAGRPVLGITNPSGDTGALLQSMGVEGVATLEDENAIFELLTDSLPRIRSGVARVPTPESVALLSRMHRTGELANVLDQISPAHPVHANDGKALRT